VRPIALIADLEFLLIEVDSKFAQPFAFDLTSTRGSEHRQRTADSVEKVGISGWRKSRLAVTSEPIHHVEWLFGSALIVAASLVG